MKKIIKLFLLLLSVCIIPVCVTAVTYDQNTTAIDVKVCYVFPANVVFKNEDISIEEKIEVGEKLIEPSHLAIDGYIFSGWYYNDKKWDFENDVVKEHMTLIAKYISEDSFNLNIIVEENSYLNPEIINEDEIKDDFKPELEGNEINPNDEVEIILEVADAEKLISEAEKAIFEKALKKYNLIIGKYLDISMYMEINREDSTKKQIYETKNKVELSIEIPEDVRFKDKKYYLFRLHDNIVEKVFEGYPTQDWKVVFESDKFSYYALAYPADKKTEVKVDNEIKVEDNVDNSNKQENVKEVNEVKEVKEVKTTKESSPITGDKILLWVWIFILSAVIVLILIFRA